MGVISGVVGDDMEWLRLVMPLCSGWEEGGASNVLVGVGTNGLWLPFRIFALLLLLLC